MKTDYKLRYVPFQGWEPLHRYTMGARGGSKWFPLNDKGYWLEPEAFSHGKITKHNYFPWAEARRILVLAMSVNQKNIELVN